VIFDNRILAIYRLNHITFDKIIRINPIFKFWLYVGSRFKAAI
jgi:hypothetical protein